MVNIGGRSKGCSACRRRRIKCDETRPICLKCQRQGLECDGPRETTFVTAEIVKSRRKVDTTSASPSQQETPAGPSSALARVSLPSSIVAGNPEDYYVMFARKHLDPQGPIDTALQQLQSQNFTLSDTDSIPTIHNSHLRTAQSFATILFGTHHKHTSITQQGLLKHGATLRHLNQILSLPNCFQFDEVLLSITTLAVQETLAPTGPKSYMSHLLGIDKFLSLRVDPQKYTSPRSLALYKCLRRLILFASLRARTVSVLALPGWKDVLRRTCVSEYEMRENEVYEVLADVSGLIGERDGLSIERNDDDVSAEEEEDQEDDQATKRNDLLTRVKEIYNHLYTWRQEWDASQDIDPMDQITSHSQPQSLPLPTRLLLLLLYNTTTLYTLNLLISLLPTTAEQDPYISAQRASLEELCRCLPGREGDEEGAGGAKDEGKGEEGGRGGGRGGVAEGQGGGGGDSEQPIMPIMYWAGQVAKEMLAGDESDWGREMREVLKRKDVGIGGLE